MTRLSIFSALLALLSVAGTALASTCMHVCRSRTRDLPTMHAFIGAFLKFTFSPTSRSQGTDSAPSLRGGRALQNMQVYNAPTYNGYRVDWCYR